jgi:ABC-type polysaccharide/polyol phosphate export permease
MEASWLLYALGFSVGTCLVGIWLFKKQQDKFILQL